MRIRLCPLTIKLDSTTMVVDSITCRSNMTGLKNLFLIFAIGIPSVVSEPMITEKGCESSKVNLTEAVMDHKYKNLVLDGYAYPPASQFLDENNVTFGCPCYGRSICKPLYCPTGESMVLQMDVDCLDDYDDYRYDLMQIFEDEAYTDSTGEMIIYRINRTGRIGGAKLVVHSRNGISKCLWGFRRLVVEKFKDDRTTYMDQSNGSISRPNKNMSDIFNFDIYCKCKEIKWKTIRPNCGLSEKGASTDDANPNERRTDGKQGQNKSPGSTANIGRDKRWLDVGIKGFVLMHAIDIISWLRTRIP